LYRFFLAGLAVVLLLTAFAPPTTPAAAAPLPVVTLAFDVVGIQEGSSVTLRTRDFPLRTNFVVRMDKPGKQAAGGLEVYTFRSEQGGVLELTVPIPEPLSDALILAVRVESKDGYLATGWFINENMAYRPKDKAVKPELSFADVRKGQGARVIGKNFPPDTPMAVRVGPFLTFYRDYVFVERVQTNPDGVLAFDLALPESLHSASHIMVRLDGGGASAANNYQNVDGGAAVPAGQIIPFQWCKVIAVRPVDALAPGEEFDAVWTIQNTSNIVWEPGTVDYKKAGGEDMHKYEALYDLPGPIGRGAVFHVAVDMIAPRDFAGWHTTTWALHRAGREMCQMKISVFVKDP
jgi:hypothetical protein